MEEKWTREDRLRFAVRFVQVNLEWYRYDWEWLKLRQDFKLFFGGLYQVGPIDLAELGGMIVSPTESIDSLNKDGFLALQREMKFLFEQFVGTEDGLPESLSPIVITLKYSALRPPGGGHSVLLANGTIRDCALGELLHLVSSTDTRSILRCPECHQIFYRQGKQIFCSRTCMNRAVVKRHRARHSAERQIPVKVSKQKPKKGNVTNGSQRPKKRR